jgi:hypothetical protein
MSFCNSLANHLKSPASLFNLGEHTSRCFSPLQGPACCFSPLQGPASYAHSRDHGLVQQVGRLLQVGDVVLARSQLDSSQLFRRQ